MKNDIGATANSLSSEVRQFCFLVNPLIWFVNVQDATKRPHELAVNNDVVVVFHEISSILIKIHQIFIKHTKNFFVPTAVKIAVQIQRTG